LQARGFKVTAFDISPTAIAWCRKRFPDSPVTYVVADLLVVDPAWHRAFDLVVESRNIQALPLDVRSKVIEAIASLVAKEGTLLVVTRRRDTDTEPPGPPWPRSDQELAQFQALGFREIRRDTFFEGEDNAIEQVRIEYRLG
jgi:ubiquinone/menaquinone biosynthesis C-methylase UbiE